MADTPLRELLAQFGFQFDNAALAQATQSIVGVIGAARSLGRTFIAGAVVQGAVHFAQSMIDTGSELDDTSAQLGLSATELTEWRHAARLAGVDAGAMSNALGRTALAAQRGSPVFRQLGVHTRDSGGQLRRTADIFEDAGVAIGALGNETRRTAIATQLFGRSGRQLIPLFRQGRNGIRDLRGEVRRLYGTDLEQLAAQAGAAGDAQDRLSTVFDAMRTRLALYLIPALTSGIETLLGWATSTWEAVRSSSAFETGLGVLAAVAVAAALATIGAWGPPVVLFALLAGGLTAVYLIAEDLVTLFRGGRSVIGEFLDEVGGVGTAARFVEHMRRQWQMLTDDIRLTIETVSEFLGLGTGAGGPGETRAATRGLDPATGISAAEDRARSAERAAASSWWMPGADQDRLQAHATSARAAVTASRPSTLTSTSSTSVGSIVVQGTTDPLETARLVRDEIESASADGDDQALADLVPEGA